MLSTANHWKCLEIYGNSTGIQAHPFHLMACCSHLRVQLAEANKPFSAGLTKHVTT